MFEGTVFVSCESRTYLLGDAEYLNAETISPLAFMCSVSPEKNRVGRGRAGREEECQRSRRGREEAHSISSCSRKTSTPFMCLEPR